MQMSLINWWKPKILIESEEFKKLFKLQQEVRMQIEVLSLELDLTKQKLINHIKREKKGIEIETIETEKDLKSGHFIMPDGTFI